MSFVAAESGEKLERREFILTGYREFSDVISTLKKMQLQVHNIYTYVILNNTTWQVWTARYLVTEDRMDVNEIPMKNMHGKKDPNAEILMGDNSAKVDPRDVYLNCHKELIASLPEYEPLIQVLFEALGQSAFGKGKERHVKKGSTNFLEQPIVELQRFFGTGYVFGQAAKKLEESQRLHPEKAKAEILGAIVYAAAGLIYQEQYVWPKGEKNAGGNSSG